MQIHLKRSVIVVFISTLMIPLTSASNSIDLQASYLRVGVGLISDSFSGRLSDTSSEALSFNLQWMN
jgi:hypothetical protein